MLYKNRNIDPSAYLQFEQDVASSSEAKEVNATLRQAEARIKQKPLDGTALSTLASCYVKLNKLEVAARVYKTLIEVQPSNSEAFYNLGTVLGKIGKHDQAILAYQQAIHLNDADANSYNGLGVSLMKLERHDKAVDCFKKAIERDERLATAFNNLGLAISEGAKLDRNINTEEAISAFQTAISLKSHYPRAKNNLAKLYLEQHAFEKGFELAESRWEANEREPLDTKKPSWAGEHQKNVLVWREQGIGDEIMFASTLSDLIKVSKNVLLLVDPRLESLFSRSFGSQVVLLPQDTDIRQVEFDYQISIGSLPKILRKKYSDFQATSSGFLKADQAMTRRLRQILKNKPQQKLIGLSWHTNSTLAYAYKRNIDLVNLMMNLLSVDATFVSLQYGTHNNDIEEIFGSTGITIKQAKGIDNFKDLDRFSALISACDEVVTIDNSTAHFAGGLGITTRLLLPTFSDWRWGLFDEKSYWYDSVHIYRQKIQGLWDHPLQQVAKALKNG